MNSWLEIKAFSRLVNLDISAVRALIDEGKLVSKEENGECFVEVSRSAQALIPSTQGVVVDEALDNGQNIMMRSEFVEKTVGAILSLHEKVLDAKEETLDALKSENRFLKEALFSMQELYDEDRKTIETLTKQLELLQDELEFTKRKYKMMWNKAVESYTPPK
jgi:predicted RNase H-like nuclease (RuvC/YqgF family)